MSASNDIKITIVATDNASTAFENVVDAADKLGPALDKAGKGAERLGPAVDEAVNAVAPLGPAVDGAAVAIRPLPAALDDVGKAARDATRPLEEAGAGASGLGEAIGLAGEKIPGAAGDIVQGLGDIITEAENTGSAVDKAAVGMLALRAAAIGAALVIGPAVMGLAINAVTGAVSWLADLLGGGDGLSDRLDDTRANAAKFNTEILKTAAGIEDAAQAVSLFAGGSAINDMVTDFARLAELQAVFQGGNPAGDFASGAVPGISSYNEAMAEAIALTGKYGLSTNDLVDGNLDLTGSLTSLADSQAMYNELLRYTGPGQDEVRQRLGELITGLQNGTISTEEFNEQLVWMTDHLYSNYVANALAADAMAQYAQAAYDAAVNVGLLNTVAERLQAAGLDSLALDVAVNLDQPALENTFNVLIGGTNRLAASSQAVADWAKGLTDASDGLSVLGELYESQLISLEEYSAGVAASTSIQEDNAAIQDEILAIQAKHLPLMAELTEQQRQYIEGLGELSDEQQIAALGFMDASQSAKAMELAYLAADAASGALGETGEATATKIITAAANADPVMKQMLLDMGLISEGAEGEVVVNFPNATSVTESVDALKASIDALTLAIGGTPPIDTSSNAAATQVDVDNLTGAVNGIPDSHNTTITATDNASGVISDVISGLNSIPATTYAAVVVSTTYTGGAPPGSAIGGGNRDGGPIGYANGGLVMASLAEAGGELLQFRDGTAAIVPHPGIYLVEPGAQVLPAPATAALMDNAARATGGGGTVAYYGPVTQQITYDASSFAMRRRGLADARRY
jgi:hypothetical protein